ncbi:hypothetical protein niasHT_013987 [Heterodera trifolii]|uniref:Uncharacterized protein n=1 Tax=Heterodera trifolii TaxID=157864 RepID=A0ABD2KLF7_9BILA
MISNGTPPVADDSHGGIQTAELLQPAAAADAAFLTVYHPDAYAWPDSDTLQRAAQALILALHYTVVVPIFLFCFFTAVRWLRLQQPGLDLAHHPPYSIDGPRIASVGVPSAGNSDRGGSSSNTSAEHNEFEHHLNGIRVASLYPPHKLPQFHSDADGSTPHTVKARPPLAKPLTHLNLHRHASELKRNESRVLSHAVVNGSDAYAQSSRPLPIPGARLPKATLSYRIQPSTEPPPPTDDRSLPYLGARPPQPMIAHPPPPPQAHASQRLRYASKNRAHARRHQQPQTVARPSVPPPKKGSMRTPRTRSPSVRRKRRRRHQPHAAERRPPARRVVGRHQQQQPRSSSTTTPRTGVAKAPPGYKTFVNNAHDDLQMWRLLFPDERAAGSDSASTVGGQPRRHQPLRGQKKTGAGRFSLSLLQPKQHAYKSVQKTSIMVIGGSNVVARSLTVESLLDPIYKDERSPACFTSVEPLLRETKRRHPDACLTRAEVTRYLAGQRVYTLHRQVRRRFRRLPTLASGLHTDWQADLADFQRLRAQNRGYAYLLVCIDTLSRQVYVQPVKSKRSDDMITALKRIFARCGYTPWRLLTDKGREFTASAVQRYLRDEAAVRHHCMETSPLWHAGMAERANRSIKERLYRYFTHRGTQCWTRVIQRIVSSLNASPNSSIFGMRPNEVCFDNAESLRQRIADRAEAERSGRASQHPRFRTGDQVRIERARGAFRKGYLPRFTDEVFTVDRVCTGRRPITYKLRDRDGEPITGLFYANDMCLVLLPPSLDDSSSSDQRKTRKRLPDDSDNNKVYAIERILERRYREDGTECCLVKWKGYSTRHNSWIPAHTII